MESRKAPDGGWGWVIVITSFIVQFLSYGSPLAVGVLYVEWLNTFGEGKGKTAWVASLANGIGLILSPICSLCVENFGARAVTIFSGMMVAVGLMVSAYAPNLCFLFFSYGVVVGLGIGLLYTSIVTITCQYFDKRRGLALGLVSTGASVGHFLYATLQKELLELYGLDGCLLIIGAMALNILPCGILMRPLRSSTSPPPEKASIKNVSSQYSIYNEKEKNLEDNVSILEKDYSEENFVRPLTITASRQESLLPEKESTTMQEKETDVYKKKVEEQKYICKHLAKRKWQLCQNYLAETLLFFKNKVFAALCFAILLYDIGGFPPLLMMEDVARSANVKEEDSIVPLVSIMGIMTGTGKIFLGVVADVKFININYLFAVTLVLMSLTLFAIPFAKSYLSLAILSGMIGFLTGNWSIFPYVTTRTVGIEKLTHAYGILMFFAGAGNSLGAPIVGTFYDWTQSYDIAFFFSAACVLLAALILLVAAIPWGNMCHKDSTKAAPRPYVYQAASQV